MNSSSLTQESDVRPNFALSVCKLTISDWWDYRILCVPSYRLFALGSTFLPIRPVWLLGTADL